MIICSVRIQNFCCLLDANLDCEPLTALVGRNGCGKSSVLRGLELFYTPSPRFGSEDFYNRDTSRDIEITVTYSDLNDEAKDRFAPYLDSDMLTVTRVLSLATGKPSAKYYGVRLQAPEFEPVRTATSATGIRDHYNELRIDPRYGDLPTIRSKDAALIALNDWEQAHPENCRRLRDSGQFFGFSEVAQGYLGRYTRFLLIPAVRDAAEDASDSRGSSITELMDLVVRSTLASREDVTAFKADFQRQYEELMDPMKLPELRALENRLNSTLGTFVPDGHVSLNWSSADQIDIPMPRATVGLVEDGYKAEVARTGHGLQRAFVLSLLQNLAFAQIPASVLPSSNGTSESNPRTPVEGAPASEPVFAYPDLILGIEEPELYQHPNRQRHLASVLLKLANGMIPGIVHRTQVLYGTHSPLFVGLDRFDQIRVLRKADHQPELPRVTEVTHVRGHEIAAELHAANTCSSGEGGRREEYTWDSLRARLQPIMTPWMNEGFFADLAVLVEGEEDRAAILGMAHFLGHELESLGISLIPCGGKSNLDRPLLIFQRFGIATYVVWDGDDGKVEGRTDNRRLLYLLQAHVEDFPATQVADKFTCFAKNLQCTVRHEIGESNFDRLLAKCQRELGMTKDATKNPGLIKRVFQYAASDGLTSVTLQSTVKRIVSLGESMTISRINHVTSGQTSGSLETHASVGRR